MKQPSVPGPGCPPSEAFSAALACWRDQLGDNGVDCDPAELERAGRTTLAVQRQVRAVLRPESVSQVSALVRTAVAHGIPLYPVSTAKNWGFGSGAPVRDGCVIVDLAQLDTIRAVDEELAFATVECGVTFRQLHDHLQRAGSRLRVAFTGSSRDTSLIANALERGTGAGLAPARAAALSELEVVLADGSVVHSGVGGAAGTRARGAYPWGVGPHLDGIFGQSNLGLVTAATVALTPVPAHLELCYFGTERLECLGEAVVALRELMLIGALAPSLALHNDYATFARIQRYPHSVLGGQPLSRALLDRIRAFAPEAWWSARWSGWLGIYAASSEHGAALHQLVAERLEPLVERLVFVGAKGPQAARWPAPHDPRRAERSFEGMEPEAALFGDPASDNLATSYWRHRGTVSKPLDPDRDRCGLIFCVAAVPLTGADLQRAGAIAVQAMQARGFEPALSVFCVAPRSAQLVASLLFSEHGDDGARASLCEREVLQGLVGAGYPPARLSISSVNLLQSWYPEQMLLSGRIKRALDPGNIIAPGRYTLPA